MTAAQEQIGYGAPCRPTTYIVGHILGWFIFEAMSPVERQFPDLAEFAWGDQDWSPTFVLAASRSQALDVLGEVVEESLSVAQSADELAVVSEHAMEELSGLIAECRAAVLELQAGAERSSQ